MLSSTRQSIALPETINTKWCQIITRLHKCWIQMRLIIVWSQLCLVGDPEQVENNKQCGGHAEWHHWRRSKCEHY